MSALSELQSALETAVTGAGYTLALVDEVEKIPAHEAGRAVIVRIVGSPDHEGASSFRCSARLSGLVPSTLAVAAGHRTTVSVVTTLRDAIRSAVLIGATWAARVIQTDSQTQETGSGAQTFTIDASIIIDT